METDILATAATLSDRELVARIDVLARTERETSAELVGHLGHLDTRPVLYAADGYGSLFAYCTQALGLSEDAACNRIEAARACRRFPVVLELLASGSLTLSAVRVLGRHLTLDNHEAVLARAKGRSRQEVATLVAELAPKPDVPTLIRRLPAPRGEGVPPTASLATGETITSPPSAAPAPRSGLDIPRPIVQPTAPQRYRIQLTVGEETNDTLRRLQDLLRREVPDGDPAVIVDRALRLLLEATEKAKLAATARPRPPRAIRPGTDTDIRTPPPPSPYIPAAVRREVWRRDSGRCAFVSQNTGQRCTERTFLEFHHLRPRAWGGPATIANLSLRCSRHHGYETARVFGPRAAWKVDEDKERFRTARPAGLSGTRPGDLTRANREPSLRAGIPTGGPGIVGDPWKRQESRK